MKDVRKMTNEPTAEEELARSMDRMPRTLAMFGTVIATAARCLAKP